MIEVIDDEQPCTSRQALAQDCVRISESSSDESDFQIQEVVTPENKVIKTTEQTVKIEIEEIFKLNSEKENYNLQKEIQDQDEEELQQEQGEVVNQEEFTEQTVTLDDGIEDFAQIEAYLETVKPIEEKPVNFKSVFTYFHEQDLQSVEDDSDEENSNRENDFPSWISLKLLKLVARK